LREGVENKTSRESSLSCAGKGKKKGSNSISKTENRKKSRGLVPPEKASGEKRSLPASGGKASLQNVGLKKTFLLRYKETVLLGRGKERRRLKRDRSSKYHHIPKQGRGGRGEIVLEGEGACNGGWGRESRPTQERKNFASPRGEELIQFIMEGEGRKRKKKRQSRNSFPSEGRGEFLLLPKRRRRRGSVLLSREDRDGGKTF